MKHSIFNNNSSYQASRLQRATRFVFEQNKFSFSFEILTPNLSQPQPCHNKFLFISSDTVCQYIHRHRQCYCFFSTYGIRRNTLQIEHNCCEGNIPLIVAMKTGADIAFTRGLPKHWQSNVRLTRLGNHFLGIAYSK